ncbi:MAG: membrane protein DedA with SNARE-associated domain/pimeloyl-ACP methyl ester carboxylesterase [Myxococcota bacterium]
MTRRRLLALYLVLLVISHVVRPDSWLRIVLSPPEPMHLNVRAQVDGPLSGHRPVVLLHGSPGDGTAMLLLSEAMETFPARYAPDLPGFGDSTRNIPDYSVFAHAQYLSDWIATEGLGPVHLVVHSMGGGVALALAESHPEQVTSITMICAIGVVELELLGSHHLNHAIHAAQLAGIWAATELIPHFGLLDAIPLNRSYARNFYDTDQRPLRDALTTLEVPLFILHGQDDPLVPVEAAREHHRIVPHSELSVLPTDHFLIFRPEEVGGVAEAVEDFLLAVEAGTAPRRADATPDRIAEAAGPMPPELLPKFSGPGLLIVGFLLAVATFVSEDLTCISAGLLVAQGRLSLVAASLSCALGIIAGDLLLVLIGRTLGRAALSRAPMSWWISGDAVDRASEWYRRYGAQVIFTSRFTPGMRLPMYVAAGVLKTPIWTFLGWFVLAAMLWTPALVGLSVVVGEPVLAWLETAERGIWGVVAMLVGMVVFLRVSVPLLTWRGRRLAVGWWRRQTRWEFWPMWRVYWPVVLAIAAEAVATRRPTLFTAANPGMPAGGFIGESKADIYRRMGGTDNPHLPATLLLTGEPAARLAAAREFVAAHGLSFPFVLKPDAGQRGQGVMVIRSWAQAETYLTESGVDALLQAFLPGHEYGVFYLRRAGSEVGEIFSITDKRLLSVTGDGTATLERLILSDPRAVCLAPLHLKVHADRLMVVPEVGEVVVLVDVGTHARGALFLDGAQLKTPALLETMERLSRGFEGGFRLGRFDVRAVDAEALMRGELMVIEVNGVTSEPTHMYDPSGSLSQARRLLIEQWRAAIAIGAEEAGQGAVVVGVWALIRELRAFSRSERGHPAGDRVV